MEDDLMTLPSGECVSGYEFDRRHNIVRISYWTFAIGLLLAVFM